MRPASGHLNVWCQDAGAGAEPEMATIQPSAVSVSGKRVSAIIGKERHPRAHLSPKTLRDGNLNPLL